MIVEVKEWEEFYNSHLATEIERHKIDKKQRKESEDFKIETEERTIFNSLFKTFTTYDNSELIDQPIREEVVEISYNLAN